MNGHSVLRHPVLPSQGLPYLMLLLALAALPSLLTACAPEPDAEEVAEVVPIAPVEIPPDIDDPQTRIWRPGYWAFEHGRFDWVPGEVIARPDPTAVWAQAYWAEHSYGWSFQQGHWE